MVAEQPVDVGMRAVQAVGHGGPAVRRAVDRGRARQRGSVLPGERLESDVPPFERDRRQRFGHGSTLSGWHDRTHDRQLRPGGTAAAGRSVRIAIDRRRLAAGEERYEVAVAPGRLTRDGWPTWTTRSLRPSEMRCAASSSVTSSAIRTGAVRMRCRLRPPSCSRRGCPSGTAGQPDEERVHDLVDVIQGLRATVHHRSSAGDGVVLHLPAYHPFLHTDRGSAASARARRSARRRGLRLRRRSSAISSGPARESGCCAIRTIRSATTSNAPSSSGSHRDRRAVRPDGDLRRDPRRSHDARSSPHPVRVDRAPTSRRGRSRSRRRRRRSTSPVCDGRSPTSATTRCTACSTSCRATTSARRI